MTTEEIKAAAEPSLFAMPEISKGYLQHIVSNKVHTAKMAIEIANETRTDSKKDTGDKIKAMVNALATVDKILDDLHRELKPYFPKDADNGSVADV